MANEAQVKLSRSAVIGGQTIGGVDELVSADTQQVYRQTVPTGSVDYEIDMAFVVADALVTAVHSTQNVTIYTNAVHTGSPTQTIAVAKNVAQIWSPNQPSAQKTFTADVTKLYVSNSSGFDAVLQVGVASKLAPSGSA